MNTVFWLIIAGLLLAAVLLLVLPLLGKTALTVVDGEQRNLNIARQQLAELKRQLQEGGLSQEQFDEQYLELQLSLNDELQAEPVEQGQGGNGRWAIPVILIFVPIVSLALYFQLADPEALQKAEVQQQNSKAAASVRGMVVKLADRLKQNPQDMEGWLMLGRSYKVLEQYQDAAKVFAKLYQFQPENVEVILNYAETLALSRNGQLAGEPADLAYKAVQVAPDNNDALWMAGMAKMQEGDAGQAISYLQKLAAHLPADSSSAQQVQQMIAEISAKQPKSAPILVLYKSVSEWMSILPSKRKYLRSKLY